MLWKYENGTNTPTPDALETLADRLDATMDFFHGRGKKYRNAEWAAIEMAFEVFDRQTESDQRRERCKRIVGDSRAPRSAAGWRTLAELIDLAVPPQVPPSQFGVLEGGKL
jgi:transcriptional regulator with XRE-family HTH domain